MTKPTVTFTWAAGAATGEQAAAFETAVKAAIDAGYQAGFDGVDVAVPPLAISADMDAARAGEWRVAVLEAMNGAYKAGLADAGAIFPQDPGWAAVKVLPDVEMIRPGSTRRVVNKLPGGAYEVIDEPR